MVGREGDKLSATPNIKRIMVYATLVAPGEVQFGLHNCRHIRSDPSQPWSQHAGSEPKRGFYGNAVDIHGSKDALDRVARALRARKTELRIQQLLWWVAAHYDHIHVATWPIMEDGPSYVPPCRGGALVTWNENGKQLNTFDDYIDPSEDGDMNTLRRGSQGHKINKLQKALNGWVTHQELSLALLKVDGDFGPATETRVKDYQKAGQFDVVDGEVDGVVSSYLMEYQRDYVDPDSPISPPLPPEVKDHWHDVPGSVTGLPRID